MMPTIAATTTANTPPISKPTISTERTRYRRPALRRRGPHEGAVAWAMLFPLIGPRLHGWLDDLVALLYVAGALALGLSGPARLVAFGGALIHFTLTRVTNYPQGTWKLLSFRTHAFVELGEG